MLQWAIDLDRCYKQPPSRVRSATTRQRLLFHRPRRSASRKWTAAMGQLLPNHGRAVIVWTARRKQPFDWHGDIGSTRPGQAFSPLDQYLRRTPIIRRDYPE